MSGDEYHENITRYCFIILTRKLRRLERTNRKQRICLYISELAKQRL